MKSSEVKSIGGWEESIKHPEKGSTSHVLEVYESGWPLADFSDTLFINCESRKAEAK